jgi:hypothetical protein
VEAKEKQERDRASRKIPIEKIVNKSTHRIFISDYRAKNGQKSKR